MHRVHVLKKQYAVIPVWITVINILVLSILIFQVYAGIVNPSLAYGNFQNIEPNRQAILTLVGRNLVMIVITVTAMLSRSPKILQWVFLLNICRELYDMLLVGYLQQFSAQGWMWMSSFLIFLLPYFFAYRKLGLISKSM